jgi:hypothetical protein
VDYADFIGEKSDIYVMFIYNIPYFRAVVNRKIFPGISPEPYPAIFNRILIETPFFFKEKSCIIGASEEPVKG